MVKRERLLAGIPEADVAELDGALQCRPAQELLPLGSLDRLGAKEATVLRMRFGLDGEKPATLQEVGDRVGLTRERVRQIEVEALARLRGQLVA